MKYDLFTILTSSLLFCAGCMVGPDFERPATDVPETFLQGTLENNATNAILNAEWWNGFNDPILLSLIDRGLTNNLSVQQAMQRVRASRASLAESRANYWPRVGVSAGVKKNKSWDPDDSATRVSAGFDASWEIDLFGGTRRGVEAAKAELAATEYSLEDARISLAAEIAGEYVNLRQEQANYEIALANLAVQTNFYAISDAKFKAGVADERDRISSEAQWRALEASLPQSKVAIVSSIRRIESLLGLNPGALDAELSSKGDVPVAPALPAAVPADLLRRRPDVRQSESRYAASLARVGVAIANRYPSVSIGAGASLSSDSLSDWGNAMKTMNIGPSINWNLLTFGRDKAKVEQAKASAEEAALAYRERVLGAVHEVESEWLQLQEEQVRLEPLTKSESLQARALELSEDMYAKDLGEYHDVLSSQQALLSARKSLIAQKANCALHSIALFKALGGGWNGPEGTND